MPGTIVNGALSFNNLTAPGAYIQVVAPNAYIPGAATNIMGIVGTASWGPKGTPVAIGAPQALTQAFGPIIGSPAPTGSKAASANYYDLVSAATAALKQSRSSGGLTLKCVRVSDGSDSAATLALKDTTTPTAVTGGTLTGLYTGSLGNGIQCVIAASSKTDGSSNVYFNVTLIPPAGSGLNQEFYPNIKGTTSASANSPFWTNLQSALASGIPGVCGPSQLATLASPSSTAENPAALAATAMAGGVDGVTTAATILTNAVGSQTAVPQTGIFALSGAGCAVAVIAGYGANASDLSSYNATVQTFCDQNGCLFFFDFPLGTSTATAVTDVTTPASGGTSDYNMVPVKDWAYWNDGVSGLRFSPMAPFAAARTATLPPWQSPLNYSISGVLGTYRSVGSGTAPYAGPEVGQCNTNGISLVASPSPGGNYLGFNAAVNASYQVNPTTAPIEYGTMTNFLARSLAGVMGSVAGQNQTNLPTDPLRKKVRDMSNAFFEGIVQQGGLATGSYSTQCDTSNNPPSQVAAHIMQAIWSVQFLASVWYFVGTLIGGTTVNVTVSQNAP